MYEKLLFEHFGRRIRLAKDYPLNDPEREEYFINATPSGRDKVDEFLWKGIEFANVAFERYPFQENELLSNEGAEEFARVKNELLTLLSTEGDRKVFIVLNTHRKWGAELVKIIAFDGTKKRKQPITVIGHDTTVGSDILDSLVVENEPESPDFYLILLKTPDPTYVEETFRVSQKIAKHRDDLIKGETKNGNNLNGFDKEAASILIRQCLAATELLKEAFIFRGQGSQKLDGNEMPKQLRNHLHSFLKNCHKDKESLNPVEVEHLGLLRFNKDAEEEGSFSFRVYTKGRPPSAHLSQFDPEREKRVPALQIGINDFQIQRVDVENGEFDADFVCSTTISEEGKESVLSELKKRGRTARKDGINRQSDPRGKLVQFPMLSGLLSIPNMRDGSVAQIGEPVVSRSSNSEHRVYKVRGTFSASLDTTKYPFDKHRLAVELQASVPEDLLTLTSFQSNRALPLQKQRGWNITYIQPLVENKVAEGNPMASLTERTNSRQFKEYAIVVGVERELLQPVLVVMLPLILLGVAAIAILFVQKETLERSPSELAMGLVLAVVAYSISYAEVVPRSGGWTDSDLLYIATVCVCMANFGAVLFFPTPGEEPSKGLDSPLNRWRHRYTFFMLITYALFLFFWCNNGGLLAMQSGGFTVYPG